MTKVNHEKSNVTATIREMYAIHVTVLVTFSSPFILSQIGSFNCTSCVVVCYTARYYLVLADISIIQA